MEKTRPGVMIYFDVAPVIEQMNDSQQAALLRAYISYGRDGVAPDFQQDPRLDTAWYFIKNSIDRDGAAYTEKCEKSRYATYVREADKKQKEPVSYAVWKDLSTDERRQLLT